MRRRLLILAAAVFLAAISGLAVLRYAHTADRRAVANRQGVWVLLATGNIPDGTTGAQIRNRRLVRQVMMPAEVVPQGAIAKLDSTFDKLKLNAGLHTDQMLMSGQFAVGATASPTPTFQVPADRIAVTLQLAVSTQVAGNVVKNDQVGVFCTWQWTVKDSPAPFWQTYLIVPRVRVLTIGESPVPTTAPTASPSPSASPTATATSTAAPGTTLERYVVTLALYQEEAQRVVNCSRGGLPYLGVVGAKASVTGPPPSYDSWFRPGYAWPSEMSTP